jgi:hypothetical protein
MISVSRAGFGTSIDSSEITDATIVAADLAANSVDSSELVDGSVDQSHFADATALAFTAGLQEGVISGCSVAEDADGESMDLDLASGTAVVEDDSSGRLIYITLSSTASVVTITTAHGSHPRIDQVVVGIDGTVDLLTGTATSGASLANRTGVASLPDDHMRLCDVLVASSDSSIADDEIRDRRPWARGASWSHQITGGDITIGTSEASFGSEVQPRLEIVSGVVEIGYNAYSTRGAASLWQQIRAFIDGTAILTNLQGIYTTNAWAGINGLAIDTIAAGSHSFDFKHRADGGGTLQSGATTEPATFWVKEILRPIAQNNATSA